MDGGVKCRTEREKEEVTEGHVYSGQEQIAEYVDVADRCLISTEVKFMQQMRI